MLGGKGEEILEEEKQTTYFIKKDKANGKKIKQVA
jgi:hypothetical protein